MHRACFILLVCVPARAQNMLDVLRLFDGNGQSPDVELRREYDYIIVGGGSAGSVLANRLSEGNNSVLLLEAGGEENFLTDVPLIAALHAKGSRDWGYRFERQSGACLGFKDKRCGATRGKVLGGTSVLNFLVYTRGNRADYDEWEALGNKNWGYDKILKYFMKSEDCSDCINIDANFHGQSGELKIEHPHYNSPLLTCFLNAGVELGYNVTDPNGRQHLGFSRVQATMKGGRRCSAAKAFLNNTVRERSNLHISERSRVVRLLINDRNVYGVELLKRKQYFSVNAKREVILSAGTFNSPQLLMLSGIGPRKELENLKIPVVQDLKVGYNLQDHVATSTLLFLINQDIAITDIKVQNPYFIFDYLVNGHGPYTIPGGALGVAFIKTQLNKLGIDYPDIELVLGSGAINGDFYGSLRGLLGLPDDTYKQLYVPFTNVPGFSITPVLLRPKSRGRVQLKDRNALHWPILYANHFQDEGDLRVFVEGIKTAVALIRTRAFSDLNATLSPLPHPACKHEPFESDEYWMCFARQMAHTLGHPVGTCKMGPSTDPDAVVDDRLRVKGVKGLRVVDASIMPNIVAGHTNSVVMMIAEKAADMIKEDWS